MNTANLMSKKEYLYQYFHDMGYSKSYILKMSHFINELLIDPHFKVALSYEDYYEHYLKLRYSNVNTLATMRQMLGRVKNFDVNDILPSKTSAYSIPEGNAKTNMPDIYLEFIKACETCMRSRGLADSTIASRRGVLFKFLSYLVAQGIHNPHCVTEEVLHGYFHNGGKLVRGIDVIKTISISIRDYRAWHGTEDFDKILCYLPDMRKRHKAYPYLTEEEVSRIEAFIVNPDFKVVSYRDFAIFVLVYFIGLRRSDVSYLKISDMDWAKDEIRVIQRKTGKPVTLPLIAVVGNAIMEYVEKERAESISDYLFLTSNLTSGRMSGGTVYDSVEKIYHACGVRMGNERKGTHLLRHHMAMALLQSNTPGIMVTELLGHESPSSMDAYLESDERSLKDCALSITPYPIGKEVFNV